MPALYKKKRKSKRRKRHRRWDGENHAQVIGRPASTTNPPPVVQEPKPEPPKGKPPLVPPPTWDPKEPTKPWKIMPMFELHKPVTGGDVQRGQYQLWKDNKKGNQPDMDFQTWLFYHGDKYLAENWDKPISELPYVHPGMKQWMADIGGKSWNRGPIPNLPLEQWSEDLPTRTPTPGKPPPLNWASIGKAMSHAIEKTKTHGEWIQPEHHHWTNQWYHDLRDDVAKASSRDAKIIAALLAMYGATRAVKWGVGKVVDYGLSKIAVDKYGNWIDSPKKLIDFDLNDIDIVDDFADLLRDTPVKDASSDIVIEMIDQLGEDSPVRSRYPRRKGGQFAKDIFRATKALIDAAAKKKKSK